uniref:Fe-S_biosyn domain-containing protein n=2 Tax=Onchocerca TaxID=6281 RepID=A0A8R1TMV9_ONCVO
MSQNAAQIRKQLINLEREERALQRLCVHFTGLLRAVELESMRLNVLKSVLQSSQCPSSPNPSSISDFNSIKTSKIAMKNWRLLFMIRKSYAKDGASADLKMTENCVNRLRKVASTGEHLRIMVDGGGCSGFEYKMSLDSKINDNDIVFCKDHIKIVVDEKSLQFLKGATVDYSEDLMRSSFRIINNPIAEKGCSCGSSFAIKMD